MGLSFISEEPFPPYQVDILLPEFWVALEADGPYHRSKHDKSRDEYLDAYYGIRILRISNIEIWSRKTKVKQDIISFLESEADTAQERKAKWLTQL